MGRQMSDFEERRMDQLAFAADEAEERWMKHPPGLPPERRQELRDDMETTKKQLTDFVQKVVTK